MAKRAASPGTKSPEKAMAVFPDHRIVGVGTLRPYPSNARTHSPEQVDKIARSIQEFGFTNPILIDGESWALGMWRRSAIIRRMASDNEYWIALPGLPGYEVSNMGRVRSLDRVRLFVGRWGPTSRRHRGRILKLKPKPNGSGAIYWCFYADGGAWPQVNRSVCLAFHGDPLSARHEAAHLDGDTGNNRPENLKWATPAENASHKIAHGTITVGSKNGAAKISEEQAAQILERYGRGEPSANLAALFGVSESLIRGVARGAIWKHVASDHRAAALARLRQNMIEAPRRN
ncbi:MAG TPA: NUMOD4 domain-containing protein [Rhodocyclaceae bacterium]|nr:NUMOD4 domain-containing protein [Rhodocyclaceae bacterium]